MDGLAESGNRRAFTAQVERTTERRQLFVAGGPRRARLEPVALMPGDAIGRDSERPAVPEVDLQVRETDFQAVERAPGATRRLRKRSTSCAQGRLQGRIIAEYLELKRRPDGATLPPRIEPDPPSVLSSSCAPQLTGGDD